MTHAYKTSIKLAIKNGIKHLFMSCSEPDWDGEGAEAISAETIINCMNFIDVLPDKMLLFPPSLAPEPDGMIEFEWYGGKNSLINISIGDRENWMHYVGILPKKRRKGRADFTKHCPSEIFNFKEWQEYREGI